MEKQLYAWIKNILFFLILMTAVMNILPNQKYKKYVRFFTGMLMVIIVIAPVAQLFGMEEKFNAFFAAENFKQQMQEIEMGFGDGEELQKKAVSDAFIKQVKMQTEQFIKEEGLVPKLVEIQTGTIDEKEQFVISQIDIIASRKGNAQMEVKIDDISITKKTNTDTNSIEEINIKNKMESFYNVPSSNINISIQG